jgi:predicted O-linked N-acetylglucosamine transferase (SPINDLY family)
VCADLALAYAELAAPEEAIEALRAVPSAQMLIKDRYAPDPSVRERITAALGAAGIDSARLRFEGFASSWADHIRTYNQVDVALDATPWSGVALAGVGELGWIADSPEAFAGIARELSADLSGLRAARTERQRRALAGPLFDAPDLAHHLGEALLAMAASAANTVE